VSKIAALSVQPLARLATGQASAPGQVKKAETETPVVTTPVPTLAPAAPVVATPTLTALIAIQANGEDKPGKGHLDPQPTHGNDDQHGHAPANPPVVAPPVVAPPVAQPPVAAPPHPVAVNTAVAARSLAILAQTLAEDEAIRTAGSAFVAAAAQREAFQAINQDRAATSLLQGLQGAMQAFNTRFDAGWGRRGLYA
jgi:hypothetical protein